MAETATAPKTKPVKKEARNNFAGIVGSVRMYIEMKIQVLSDVSGSNADDVTKARIEELKLVLGKLEAK